jgi:hypothetical protein
MEVPPMVATDFPQSRNLPRFVGMPLAVRPEMVIGVLVIGTSDLSLWWVCMPDRRRRNRRPKQHDRQKKICRVSQGRGHRRQKPTRANERS